MTDLAWAVAVAVALGTGATLAAAARGWVRAREAPPEARRFVARLAFGAAVVAMALLAMRETGAGGALAVWALLLVVAGAMAEAGARRGPHDSTR
ncbi:MAG TPA: hypothetical protein VM889_02705 [Candidatus Thermoplasmatota archaeon]|nr:hypothetical protein [Candidatus Thermoplasmatota archaeon]